MKDNLIVTGYIYVEGLGQLEKTINFSDATEEQRKYNTRLIFNKRNELIKRITTQDLIKLDNTINIKKEGN